MHAADAGGDPGPRRAARPLSRSRGRRQLLAAALVGASLALAALVQARPGTLDDAFVVLVQARHLVAGEGLAVRAGGPPVDASTSLLDVLQKAALLALRPVDPVRSAAWLDLAWLAAAGGIGAALGAALARRTGALRVLIAALAVAGAPGLAEGAAYRLDTPLFAALWLLVLAAVAAPRADGGARLAWGAVLWAPLLAFARPEGLILGPAAWLAIERRQRRPSAEVLRRAAALVALLALWHAARAATFGSPFPNSYHAKRAASLALELADGLAYVGAFLVTPAGLALAGAALGAAALSRAGGAGRSLLGLSVVALAVVVAGGGDAYVGARLLVPATLAATLGVLAVAGEGAAARDARAAGTARPPARPAWLDGLLAAGLLASAAPALAPALRAPAATWRALAAGPAGAEDTFGPDRGLLARVAEALAGAATPADPAAGTLAHRHAQRYAWYAPDGLPLLDLTGLTDPELARLPVEGPVRFGRDALDVALERGVGALQLDHAPWRPVAWAGREVERVLSAPDVALRFLGAPLPAPELSRELARRYRTATLLDAWGPGRHVNLLVRTDLAARFVRAGFTL